MKLWIDAQLSPSLAKWITENFDRIEAIAIRDLGLRDAEDQVIFFSARSAEATVMTKDGDFLELQKEAWSAAKNYLGHLRKYIEGSIEDNTYRTFAKGV